MHSKTPTFSFLDHTADLGILVRGRNLEKLFENAAQAMMKIMVKGKASQTPKRRVLEVYGQDLPDLMVRWLGEILYIFEGEEEIVTHTSIGAISPSRLEAELKTVSFDPARHEVLCEIKAVTYHQIEVTQKGDHWESRIVFDV